MGARRVTVLKKIQYISATPVHKIPAPGHNWWLSLHLSVPRIFEKWNSLSLYFTSTRFDDLTNSNKLALSALKNPFMKVLIMFVDYVIGL